MSQHLSGPSNLQGQVAFIIGGAQAEWVVDPCGAQ